MTSFKKHNKSFVHCNSFLGAEAVSDSVFNWSMIYQSFANATPNCAKQYQLTHTYSLDNSSKRNISMAKCKTAVTPLLMHWSYCSLALSHRYHQYSSVIMVCVTFCTDQRQTVPDYSLQTFFIHIWFWKEYSLSNRRWVHSMLSMGIVYSVNQYQNNNLPQQSINI